MSQFEIENRYAQAGSPVALGIEVPAGVVVDAVAVTGMPADAKLDPAVPEGGGRWRVEPDRIGELTFEAPAGLHRLTVEILPQGASDAEPHALEVGMIALTATDRSGPGGAPVALELALEPADAPVEAVAVTGLPDGAKVEPGTDEGAGCWSVQPADLTEITVEAPEGAHALGVALTLPGGGDPIKASLTLTVQAPAPQERAAITAPAADGRTDALVPLAVSLEGADDDKTQVSFARLPEGARLTAGERQADGSWSVPAARLGNLWLEPPRGYVGRFAVEVSARVEGLADERQPAPSSLLVNLVAPSTLLETVFLAGSMMLLAVFLVDNWFARFDEAQKLLEKRYEVEWAAPGNVVLNGKPASFRYDPSGKLVHRGPIDDAAKDALLRLVSFEVDTGARPPVPRTASPAGDGPALSVASVHALAGKPALLDVVLVQGQARPSVALGRLEVAGLPRSVTLDRGAADASTGRWVVPEPGSDALTLELPGKALGPFELTVFGHVVPEEGDPYPLEPVKVRVTVEDESALRARYASAIDELTYRSNEDRSEYFMLLLMLAGISGAIGVQIRTLMQLVQKAAHENVLDVRRWWPWYFMRPFAGFLLGILVILFIKSELFVPGGNAQAPTGGTVWWLSVAILIGFAADDFGFRLRLLAQALIGKGDSRRRR